MAGRGTDIVLGGSWQAKVEKLDNPTQDQIDAIKAEWKQVHDQVLQAAAYTSLVLSVTNLAVSITSCVVVLVVKVMRFIAFLSLNGRYLTAYFHL